MIADWTLLLVRAGQPADWPEELQPADLRSKAPQVPRMESRQVVTGQNLFEHLTETK